MSQSPEGFGGGQPGGADGGQEPSERADEEGGGQAAGPGLGRDDDGFVVRAVLPVTRR